MKIIKDIGSYEDLKNLMEEERNIILYFGSDLWSVCHSVFPQLENIIRAYDINIIKIDVDSKVEIRGQFLAFVMPTIIIISDGREVLREARFIDFSRIEKIINEILN